MPDGQRLHIKPHSPLAVYQSQLGETLSEDACQLQAVEALDRLYYQITEPNLHTTVGTKGLYMWGDVGRGKTFLMDLFYDCLAQEGKLRLHFHRFMAQIHQSLNEYSGQQDPLVKVAKALVASLGDGQRVVCFDEFFVSDIGDAMLLSGLFECLFSEGVVLVATSNIPIERLYENGLARHKFLPCIGLLQRHTQMIYLNGQVDHRLQDMAQTDNTDCLIPSDYIGLSTQMDFAKSFKQLAHERGVKWQRDTHIQICRRHIDVIQVTQEEPETAQSIVWFDFHALCDGPRSQLDYMEIAQQFAIVMISNVPALGAKPRNWIKARGTEDGVGSNQAATTGERVVNYSKNDNKARRFISLIDELYDQNVTLYLSCDVPLTELYLDGALIFEFRRTYSRLVEMSRGPAQIPSSYALSN